MEYLSKRQPLPAFGGGWTIQDEMASKSSFDFRGSDLGYGHERLEFVPIAPKDSLVRTTFWLSVESPGRIKFKCNLGEPSSSVTLETLKEAIRRHDRLEASREVCQSDESSEEEKVRHPQRQNVQPVLPTSKPARASESILAPVSENSCEKHDSREKMRRPVAAKFSKTGRSKYGRSSNTYKFIDWEKNKGEKLYKPLSYDELNQYRTKRVLSTFMEVIPDPKPKEEKKEVREPKPLLGPPKKKTDWITLTDSVPVSLPLQPLNSNRKQTTELRKTEPTDSQVKIRGISKIFQGKSPSDRDLSSSIKDSVSYPLVDTRTRIGVIEQDLQLQVNQKVVKVTEVKNERKTSVIEQPVLNQSTIYKYPDEDTTKSVALLRQRMSINSQDRFDYCVVTPPYELDSKGHLNINYIDELSKIYAKNPVKSLHYCYHGKDIMTHEKIILQLMNKYEYADPEEKAKKISFIHKQYTVLLDEAKNNSDLSIIKERPRFKYTLIKVGLDDKLTKEDLEHLCPQEYRMMVAFFNVKFAILDKPDRLNLDDQIEHVIKVANAHIEGVLPRANNFKKNEEFLKKKWKEFLKFCRFKVKEECNLKRSLD